MSDTILGVIIGGTFGFLGALLGNIINIWAEGRKEKRESLHAIRLRLVGDRVQISEIMRFIASQRQRHWPFFWRKGIADLSEAQLEGTDFRYQDLRNVKLYRANLQKVNFFRANLQGCDFTNADLSEADLFEADARQTTWFQANLRNTRLMRTNLAGSGMVRVILSEANLMGANFRGVDARFANLEGAIVGRSDLSNMNLARANLRGATLEDTNLTGTVYDEKTTWPEGFDPQQARAELIAQSNSRQAMEQAGFTWRWGKSSVEGVKDD